MSKPVSVSNWLLQYLLKQTAERLPEEDACSLPEAHLIKVIKVLLSYAGRWCRSARNCSIELLC